jgi:hypothetical protein
VYSVSSLCHLTNFSGKELYVLFDMWGFSKWFVVVLDCLFSSYASSSHYIASNNRMIDESGKMFKEVAMACCKILSQYMSGGLRKTKK